MYQRYIKRILDFMLSLCAIVVLSPLFLLLIILVRVNLGSPVFFKQQRPGKDEKIFKMIKFRTMKDAVEVATGRKVTDEERLKLIEEKGENAVSSDTQRLTRFGRVMRKLSLDELPELFNILKGDMSIVGPRPLAVIYLSYYDEREKHRHDVRPGLTGLAQVNGRNAISWKKRFEYDLEYVNNISFLMDLNIILKTIGVVFKHDDIGQGEERPVSFCEERQREWDAVKQGSEKQDGEKQDILVSGGK